MSIRIPKNMKKFLILAVMAMAAISVHSQNLVSTMIGNMGNAEKEDITQVNLSGKILRMAAKNDTAIDAKTLKAFENIDKISVAFGESQSLGNKMQLQLSKITGNYEELLTVVENGEEVRMYTRESGNYIDELVMSVFSANNTIVMSITGRIDLNQISSLAGKLNINGAEHLNKIKKNK